ncbi:hypothetical protein I6F14_23795 [Bradyrhizobium sp. IC3069]|uniref:Uncharacterized protein n=1 Tax=Bradyrhizobium yuanmingense TaxID=108015 RepID=A0ABV4GM55_9BRAD|nr:MULTISPECIES: hypothetical protein [Bradyrhizobium]MCA1363424.1 hypothetical protein [Bradyrhizobium sp. IC4059]MCA1379129.1 hypothetical protein [Bradyrhizobium sp. IC4060]MCA1489280.1 hypothetical protein [Bradyrhizobium sp. IC4061]MCA1520962.1 hypothetical protein [Bradyrhizobium sp. IC3069]
MKPIQLASRSRAGPHLGPGNLDLADIRCDVARRAMAVPHGRRDHPRRLQLAGVCGTRQFRLDGPDEQIARYVAENL